MKFAKHSFFIVVLSVLIFNSCKNELKLNAPYKEIPSIYAILNPRDSVQMIRINKVFLGEGDANQMAQVADSINYPAGELTVTLERNDIFGNKDLATTTGNKQVVTFRDSLIETKPGSFAKTQRVYVTADKLIPSGIYFLKVKNNKTGNVFTAKTAAFDSIKGNQGGVPLAPPYYPYLPSGFPNDNSAHFIDYGSDGHDGGSVRFVPNAAAIYNLIIRFHFYDLVGGNKNYKYVDYVFGNKNAKDVQKFAGQDFLIYNFKKADMFAAVGTGLSKMGLDNNISGRKMYKIQYLIHSTTQDYIDYMQYVTPSLSIAQNKPLYSNFDNSAALGIFTFRTRCSVYKEMATPYISSFAYDSNTCSYQFYTATDQKPGCN